MCSVDCFLLEYKWQCLLYKWRFCISLHQFCAIYDFVDCFPVLQHHSWLHKHWILRLNCIVSECTVALLPNTPQNTSKQRCFIPWELLWYLENSICCRIWVIPGNRNCLRKCIHAPYILTIGAIKENMIIIIILCGAKNTSSWKIDSFFT